MIHALLMAFIVGLVCGFPAGAWVALAGVLRYLQRRSGRE
jgi:hypothetical protein